MYYFKPITTIRDKVLEAVEVGTVDKDDLIIAMLNYLSVDDVKDMLHKNEIDLALDSDNEDDDEDEQEEE